MGSLNVLFAEGVPSKLLHWSPTMPHMRYPSFTNPCLAFALYFCTSINSSASFLNHQLAIHYTPFGIMSSNSFLEVKIRMGLPMFLLQISFMFFKKSLIKYFFSNEFLTLQVMFQICKKYFQTFSNIWFIFFKIFFRLKMFFKNTITRITLLKLRLLLQHFCNNWKMKNFYKYQLRECLIN